MKIANFYIRNVLAGWYAVGGYEQAFERLGHEYFPCALPGNMVQQPEYFRDFLPTLDFLLTMDVVLIQSAEYTFRWLAAVYGQEQWDKLRAKVPVVARFDESTDRGEVGMPNVLTEIWPWADRFCFHGKQDAAKYNGTFTPVGTDPSIYTYGDDEKLYDVVFIGSMYPTRQKYLETLAKYGSDINFHVGQVSVNDLSGMKEPESTHLLAQNYRQTRIFFCLPPLSNILVSKLFDVMSCGTFVMYPKLPGEAAVNMEVFQDKVHLAYYEPGYMIENLNQIRYYLENDKEREQIARDGRNLVRKNYTIDHLLGQMLQEAREAAKIKDSTSRAVIVG
jgi:hypothetical protein